MLAFAVYRVARLFSRDTITNRMRGAILQWSPAFYEFFTCEFCTGFWLSIFGIILFCFAYPVFLYIVFVFGIAGLHAFLVDLQS